MANTDNFDPKSVKKLSALEILKRVGPGIIMTGIVIGPGNITTSSCMRSATITAMLQLHSAASASSLPASSSRWAMYPVPAQA